MGMAIIIMAILMTRKIRIKHLLLTYIDIKSPLTKGVVPSYRGLYVAVFKKYVV